MPKTENRIDAAAATRVAYGTTTGRDG